MKKQKGERKGERPVKWIAFFYLWYFCYPFLLLRGGDVMWYPAEIEVRLILSSLGMNSGNPSKKWQLRENVGHRGDINRCWYLVTSGRRTPEGRRREKPNDWLGPQNGSGDSPPTSAEIDSKKVSFWAGFVAGRRIIASIPGWRQKNIWDTRDPRFFKPV